MSKLLEHFKQMQGMASRYLEPAPYTTTHIKTGETVVAAEHERNATFISDVIYMLDGPEQREAEASVAADLEAEAAEWRMDIRKQVEQADAIATAARAELKRVDAERDRLVQENNELRSRLMDSELAYAKLSGYLDRIEDERPPLMVPQERERFTTRSRGDTDGYFGHAGHMRDSDRPRRWFHR